MGFGVFGGAPLLGVIRWSTNVKVLDKAPMLRCQVDHPNWGVFGERSLKVLG